MRLRAIIISALCRHIYAPSFQPPYSFRAQWPKEFVFFSNLEFQPIISRAHLFAYLASCFFSPRALFFHRVCSPWDARMRKGICRLYYAIHRDTMLPFAGRQSPNRTIHRHVACNSGTKKRIMFRSLTPGQRQREHQSERAPTKSKLSMTFSGFPPLHHIPRYDGHSIYLSICQKKK